MVKAEDALDTTLKSSHRLSRKWKFKELQPPQINRKHARDVRLKAQKPCQIYFTKNPSPGARAHCHLEVTEIPKVHRACNLPKDRSVLIHSGLTLSERVWFSSAG
jgi:hypothetical protein